MTIYLDNAASSWPKPNEMMQAMSHFNDHIGGNPGRSGHRLSIDAARVVFDTRERLARLLGSASPDSIVFTRNATEAINVAVLGMLKAGDHVIASGMEHNAVMRPLRAAQLRGVDLTVVPCSPQGCLDPADVARAIRPSTKALFVLHASNVTGTLMPLEELADLAHAHGIHLCVDASQTAGCVPIDVAGSQIDLLFFTGHKALCGPQGTGGMYLRPGLEAEVAPLILGGTGSRSEDEEQPDFMPDRYESGTPNAIGLAGLGAGIDHLFAQGIAAIRQREVHLTQFLLDGLAEMEGVTVHGPGEASRMAAVVSFTLEGTSPSDIASALADSFDILTRPGLHCAPAAHRTLGTFPMGTVRCSLGVFTTDSDIRATLRALESLPR